LAIGLLARDRSPFVLFLVSVAVTAAGWLLVWLTVSPVLAVIGLLVIGLGVAGQFPLGAAIVMALSAGQPDRAIAVMSVGVGVASGLGPFVLGALADNLGVQVTFLVVPVLCLVSAGFLAAGERWGRRVGPA
jgi:MFS family permease